MAEATMQLSDDVRRMLLEERRSKVTLTQNIEQDLLSQILEQRRYRRDIRQNAEPCWKMASI